VCAGRAPRGPRAARAQQPSEREQNPQRFWGKRKKKREGKGEKEKKKEREGKKGEEEKGGRKRKGIPKKRRLKKKETIENACSWACLTIKVYMFLVEQAPRNFVFFRILNSIALNFLGFSRYTQFYFCLPNPIYWCSTFMEMRRRPHPKKLPAPPHKKCGGGRFKKTTPK
jgi:hypothetical protein